MKGDRGAGEILPEGWVCRKQKREGMVCGLSRGYAVQRTFKVKPTGRKEYVVGPYWIVYHHPQEKRLINCYYGKIHPLNWKPEKSGRRDRKIRP